MNNSVLSILSRKESFLNYLKNNGTPAYIFDSAQTKEAIIEFQTIFERHIPKIHIYYAVKSNPYEGLIAETVRAGYGLDVSSGRELELVLAHNPHHILFTGPGKTNAELELAIKHADKVTINIDSFGELRRLHALAAKKKITIKAGIRVNTSYHGAWNKFGIPLQQLLQFWTEAQQMPFIELQGIQTHMSWNTSAHPFENVLTELGTYISTQFPEEYKRHIQFIDFGGGYIPYNHEGYFRTQKLEKNVHSSPSYAMQRSLSIESFAQKIATSITHAFAGLECDFYTEPGRIISYQSMHIALRVIDVKNDREIIVDGGTNIIGWEKYEEAYAPIINLTHPSTEQKPYVLYGSLCTPHDIWGYYCYASEIIEGDILIIPNQGAYTYTLGQNFIKSIAPVIDMVYYRYGRKNRGKT